MITVSGLFKLDWVQYMQNVSVNIIYELLYIVFSVQCLIALAPKFDRS